MKNATKEQLLQQLAAAETALDLAVDHLQKAAECVQKAADCFDRDSTEFVLLSGKIRRDIQEIRSSTTGQFSIFEVQKLIEGSKIKL